MSRYNIYSDVLKMLEQESRLRHIPEHSDGSCMDFCTNDYMGLRNCESELRAEFDARFGHARHSASASRLLAPDQYIAAELEGKLRELYGRPALLFNSGYHANTGIASALNVPGTLFVADKLVHASMIDGLTMGRCEFIRFPHNDTDALARILQREHGKHRRIIIMAESVYSMDGDKAPLAELAELRNRYEETLLYVDEAHAFGVRGERGLGLCEETGLLADVDILVGTLGKAAYSSGAFCIVPEILRDFLVNRARSFIFSTSLPPANLAWSIVTIDKLVSMSAERENLMAMCRRVHSALGRSGEDTPIAPLYINDAAKAVEVSRRLADKGISALPIRRPTVPEGTERIRFSLNASLTDRDIDHLLSSIRDVISKLDTYL